MTRAWNRPKKKRPVYRKSFGGYPLFELVNRTPISTKAEADAKAKKLRKQGWNARISTLGYAQYRTYWVYKRRPRRKR